jgi:hypothetical protein
MELGKFSIEQGKYSPKSSSHLTEQRQEHGVLFHVQYDRFGQHSGSVATAATVAAADESGVAEERLATESARAPKRERQCQQLTLR